MSKQAITIDDLIESLNACVRGDSCERCIECENLKVRFCWVSLMRKTAEVLEQIKPKEKFHEFLWNTILPNEMETYISMYNSGSEKGERKDDE